MKTVNQDAKSKIITFLASNPNSDAKAIEKAVSIPRQIVFKTIGELSNDKQVVVYQKNPKSVKLFSAVSMPSVEKAKEAKATPVKTKPEVKSKALTITKKVEEAKINKAKPVINTTIKAKIKAKAEVPKAVVIQMDENGQVRGKNFGRNFEQYEFMGEHYRKGKLAHAIIKELIRVINPTFKQLTALVNHMVPTWGTVVDAAHAKKVNNGGKQRFFTASMLITLPKEKVQIAVTNQWSSTNIVPLLEMAKSYGLKITKIAA